jgi:hypothetical protein
MPYLVSNQQSTANRASSWTLYAFLQHGYGLLKPTLPRLFFFGFLDPRGGVFRGAINLTRNPRPQSPFRHPNYPLP